MVMQKEREMRHSTKYGRSVMAYPPSPERDSGNRHKSFRSDVIDERALARISSASCKYTIFKFTLHYLYLSLLVLIMFQKQTSAMNKYNQ